MGIAWILENSYYQQLRIAAREKEQEFAIDLKARRCLSLYQKILEKNSHSLKEKNI